MGNLNTFHFKFDFFGACGYMTSFVLFYVWAGQRSDTSLTILHGALFQDATQDMTAAGREGGSLQQMGIKLLF